MGERLNFDLFGLSPSTGDATRRAQYGRFRFDGAERMTAIGGNWSYPATSRTPLTDRRAGSTRLDVIEWRGEVPAPDPLAGRIDQFAYLMPVLASGAETEGLRTISDVEIGMSLAQGGRYVVYLAPVQIHGQSLLCNSWNALPIPPADLSGDLMLELCAIRNGAIVFDASHTLKSSF